jgi:Double zinc ribbon
VPQQTHSDTPQQTDPEHAQTRDMLRVAGPLGVIAGVIFFVIGLPTTSFVNRRDSNEYLWCLLVGGLLVGLGMQICKFAFMGAVRRYMAHELAPVGTDAVNYMAEGTKDAVRDVAAAVGEGLRAGAPSQHVPVARCNTCNSDNDASANFCKGCGTALAKAKPCASCSELNDPNARFCDQCGKAMT